MPRMLSAIGIFAVLVFLSNQFSLAADDADPLQGVWIAETAKADGKSLPEEVVKNMRFTFKGDKLFIRGNSGGEKEDECAYKIDSKQSPMHLDISPPEEKKPVLAIYEVKKDQLKICLRHSSSSEGRPDSFDAKPESKRILMIFKEEKK
ncbi:MAG: hypothetical protein JWM11_1859 [Planctomycetaceae bacterium]|nr:hypothetical protein [Planctomycetaceae bacterium]